MNKIKGKILDIKTSGNLSIVQIDAEDKIFYSIVVESPQTAPYLRIGNPIYVLFKETEVSIGKNLQGKISMRNRFECRIENIEKGQLLTRIALKCGKDRIVSLITTASFEEMELKVGDVITAFIKTNEISLMEI